MIKEALDRAVNRVVKWFILILVIVFDPLAVTLVIAYNASLLRIKKGDVEEVETSKGDDQGNSGKGGLFRWSNLPIFLLLSGFVIFGIYSFNQGNNAKVSAKSEKASLIGELSAERIDDRAFAYVPEKSFGVISFSGMRMVDEVGLSKVFSEDFVERIPFIGSLAWDPESCGIQSQGRALYFLQFPGEEDKEREEGHSFRFGPANFERR